MIPPPSLEIAVLVLGMVILMLEAFAERIDKRTLAFAAIGALTAVLISTWFLAPSPAQEQATGFWSFYTADPLSIFFKRFALLTTILVLIMMIDYAPVVVASFPGSKNRQASANFLPSRFLRAPVSCTWFRQSISSSSLYRLSW